MKSLLTLSIILFGMLAMLRWSRAEVGSTTKPAQPKQSVIEQITEQLKSKNNEDVDRAIVAIRNRFLINGEEAGRHVNGKWIDPLIAAGRYENVEEFALDGILDRADERRNVYNLQVRRIQALRKLKKYEEMLQAAKGLYNVSSMKETTEAAIMLGEALVVARPDDKTILSRFRAEQVAGAIEALDGKLTKPAPAVAAPTVLSGIIVDAGPYQEKLRELEAESGYKSWSGQGNLLLLADQPTKALEVFRQAYRVADDDKLAEATESIARCMRAQDGGVARANAWILSLRPKDKK